jgi:hypothetical protein
VVCKVFCIELCNDVFCVYCNLLVAIAIISTSCMYRLGNNMNAANYIGRVSTGSTYIQCIVNNCNSSYSWMDGQEAIVTIAYCHMVSLYVVTQQGCLSAVVELVRFPSAVLVQLVVCTYPQ